MIIWAFVPPIFSRYYDVVNMCTLSSWASSLFSTSCPHIGVCSFIVVLAFSMFTWFMCIFRHRRWGVVYIYACVSSFVIVFAMLSIFICPFHCSASTRLHAITIIVGVPLHVLYIILVTYASSLFMWAFCCPKSNRLHAMNIICTISLCVSHAIFIFEYMGI